MPRVDGRGATLLELTAGISLRPLQLLPAAPLSRVEADPLARSLFKADLRSPRKVAVVPADTLDLLQACTFHVYQHRASVDLLPDE